MIEYCILLICMMFYLLFKRDLLETFIQLFLLLCLGYLISALFLHEGHELVMLLVNTLQKVCIKSYMH